MEALIPILFLLGWIGTVCLGWKIMKWKHRWAALGLTVLFPYIGLLFALLLDQKCPHCRSYISMAATVCPKCGRTIKTGKVDVEFCGDRPLRR